MKDDNQAADANANRAIRDSIRERHAQANWRIVVLEELEDFKVSFQDAGRPLLFEWGNSLRLGEDDWILRQLFEMSGCDSTQIGHWRLLLGVLAETFIDPDRTDTFKRKYSPAAVQATRWKVSVYDRLFNEASELARVHQKPRWGRQKICKYLADNRRFSSANGKWHGVETLRDRLNEVLKSKRSALAAGEFDADPQKKTDVARKLSYFRFNNTSGR